MAKHDQRLFDAICRKDFLAFARKAFQIVNPGASWLHNWHLEAIAHSLNQVQQGDCTRLIVTLPPRSLKSFLISVALPAFVLGKLPTKKIICVSYSQDLAEKHASDCRRLMSSDWYRHLFGNHELTKNAANEIETDRGGFRLATSVEGVLTGRGGDLILIDDALSAKDAYAKSSREAVNEWFSKALITRLDNPSKGAIVVVMQRLHEDDLAGHLLGNGGWEHLNLPAIAPSNLHIDLSRKTKCLWKKGELLHPEHLSERVLNQLARDMGSYLFNAQVLQAPVSETGNLLKRNWLKYCDTPPRPTAGDEIVQSWDTALKAGDTNDYSVCLTFLVRNKNEYYLLDVLRRRLEFPELSNLVAPHASRLNARTVLIEEHGSGIPLIQNAKRAGVQGVIPIKHSTDKKTRMMGASPKIEAGSLILPKSAPWLFDFETEYAAFPKGKYDDQMDALSQFLNWRQNKEECPFEADFGHGSDAVLGAPSIDDIPFYLGLAPPYHRD